MDLTHLCDALPSVKTLVLKDGCYKVEYKSQVLVDFCCIGKNLAYPLDGFEKIFTTLSPNTNHVLFDNQLEVPSPSYENKLISRGIILYIFYAEKDANGETIADDKKNIGLLMTDVSGNEFTLPLYNTFSLLTNPITDDKTKMINKMEIINNNNFEVTVSGLIILVDRDGVDMNSMIGCG